MNAGARIVAPVGDLSLMIEVELKFRLEDPEALLEQLIARGALRAGETLERDTYLAHPARDFSATNEAFRVRWDGSTATLTYKGPVLDLVSKTREELEITLRGEQDADAAILLFERLGFRAVGEVEKRRTKFHLPFDGCQVTVCVDDVLDLGLYVELEVLARPEEWKLLRDRLQDLAQSLGLQNSERRSYLELRLAKLISTPGTQSRIPE